MYKINEKIYNIRYALVMVICTASSYAYANDHIDKENISSNISTQASTTKVDTYEFWDLYTSVSGIDTFAVKAGSYRISGEQSPYYCPGGDDVPCTIIYSIVKATGLFQIRKSSSSIYANIREANYGQSRADMLSKFGIALKECSETEGWLKLLFNTKVIDEEIFKYNRNLCGRIIRMLIARC